MKTLTCWRVAVWLGIGTLMLAGRVSSEEPAAAKRGKSWHKTVDATIGIRFETPAKPQISQEGNSTKYGLTTDGGETAFNVAIHKSNDPNFAASATQSLDKLRDGLVMELKGKILDEEEILLGEHPGRDLTLKLSEGLALRQRSYVYDQQLIQVMVVLGPKSTAGPADVTRFFNSVQLGRGGVPDAPATDVAELTKQGMTAISNGKWDQAIEAFSKAIEIEPTSIEPYFYRAIGWEKKHEFQRAIDDLSHVLEIAPDNVASHNNRGWYYALQGDYDQAIADYDEALRLSPEYALSYKNRGWAHFAKKELDKAASDLQAAVRLEPDFAWAHFNLATVLSAQRKYTQAVPHYKRVLELDPNYLFARNQFAWLLATCPDAKVRDGQQAVEVITPACQATEFKNPYVLDTLAAAQAEAGDFEAAIKWQTEACGLVEEDAREELQAHLDLFRIAKPVRDRKELAGNRNIVLLGEFDPRTTLALDAQADEEGFAAFTNTRDGLNEKLAEAFVKFSFRYPKSWRFTRAGTKPNERSFVDVERVLEAGGKPFIADSFSIGFLQGTGSGEMLPALLPKLAQQMSGQLAAAFREYELVSQNEVTINGANGYEFRFTGIVELEGQGDVKLFGRCIMLTAQHVGKPNGAVITIAATELQPGITSVKDVGEKGAQAEMLRSFQFERDVPAPPVPAPPVPAPPVPAPPVPAPPAPVPAPPVPAPPAPAGARKSPGTKAKASSKESTKPPAPPAPAPAPPAPPKT